MRLGTIRPPRRVTLIDSWGWGAANTLRAQALFQRTRAEEANEVQLREELKTIEAELRKLKKSAKAGSVAAAVSGGAAAAAASSRAADESIDPSKVRFAGPRRDDAVDSLGTRRTFERPTCVFSDLRSRDAFVR